MRRSTARFGLLLSALLLTTTLSTHAEPWPQPAGSQFPRTAAPSTPAPAAIRQSGDVAVYLPQISSQTPEVPSLVFSTKVDGNGPVDPGSVFDYGFTELYITARVLDGQGLTWRTVWLRDGVADPNLGFSGTVGSEQELVIDGICFGTLDPNGQIQCSAPIHRGTYQVDFYLGTQLFRTSTAVVR